MTKKWFFLIIYVAYYTSVVKAQCLSSVNPVGGTDNLLVLEKKTMRAISFYKYGQKNQYYMGNSQSDFDLINKARYNYLSTIVGYGLSHKLTIEIETGYFLNKTQDYNFEPSYSVTGRGFSNAVVLFKQSLFSDPFRRIFITSAAGAKIPFSRKLQSKNGVRLPIDVQPTIGAFGAVINNSFVLEKSGSGMRYFFTNRIETNAPNKLDYQLGNLTFNSLFISRHLRQSWLKNNWTVIFQIRNEIRGYDKISGIRKESTGSILLFIAPQLNYVIKEDFYISAMADIPVYQHFNGTQLGAGLGLTLIVSKTINF